MRRLLGVISGMAMLMASFGVFAQTWVDYATVSMTNATTPKLTANRLCYTDGTDVACDGAAGLLTTSGTLSITNISVTNLTVGGVAVTGGGSADRITSGTASAIANTTGGYISLTTGNTTWGYLGSSATFLPLISGNTASYTSILGTISTANQPNITGLGTIVNLNATTGNIATVVASTVSSSSGLFTNLSAAGTSTLATVTASSMSSTVVNGGTASFTTLYVAGVPVSAGASGDRITSGTASAIANTTGGYISLTTGNTTWGYLGSSATFLPLVNGTTASFTTVSGTNHYGNTASFTSLYVGGVAVTGGGSTDRIASGTASAIANTTGGYISLTTGNTTWGYLGSSATFLPLISGNTASFTTLSVGGQNVLTGSLSGTLSIDDLSDASSTVTSANLYLGSGGGNQNTTGVGNTSVGVSALSSNTTGSSNIAIGNGALTNNTTGGSNIAIGYRALYANSGTTTNLAIGTQTLNTHNNGNGNVALGYRAMLSHVDGANNVAIGPQAAAALLNGSNNIAIGATSALYATSASYQLSIGNAIYGNIGSGSGNANLIGINVSSPTANLEVSGTVSVTSLYVGGVAVTGGGSADRITSGTASAIANTTGGYISLTTGNTTWGYLGSSATFLPLISGNTASYTSILGTISTANQPNITGLGTIVNLNATTGNIATVVASTVSSSSGLFTNLGATGTSTLGAVVATSLSGTNVYGNTASFTTLYVGGVAVGSTNLSETLSINDLSDASSTVASANLYIGKNAGNLNTTGVSNTSVGIGALTSNSTGVRNSAFGWQALASLTGGHNNTAIGARSLANNTTGLSNVGVGIATLSTNTTGTGNVAVGTNALAASTESYNVGVGQGALINIQGGSYNVAMGTSAGQATASSVVSNSVMIGAYAGSGLGNSTNNTLIGYNAGSGITTGSSNTVIGTNAAPYSNTGNYQLSLANALWGDVGSGLGNANRLGINVSSPTANLEVSGTVSVTSLYVGGVAVTGGGGTSGDRITSGTASAIANTTGGYISLTTGNTTWGYLGSSATFLPLVNGTTTSFTNVYGSAASVTNVYASNKLGVGRASPVAALDVAGAISASGPIQVGTSSLTCSSAISGTMRFNAVSNTMEYCNSSSWSNLATSSTSPVAFSVIRGVSDQTVAASTWTKVQLNSETFDTNNNFDSTTNYRFTPTVAGKYLITGQLYCGGSSACYVSIYKNGGQVSQVGLSTAVSNPILPTSAIVDMNGSTDYVELYGWSGGTNFVAGSQYTFLNGVLLSPQSGGGGGGGATPAGSSNDVQYNSGGALAADTGNFTYASSVLKAPTVSATTVTGTNVYGRYASFTTLYVGGVAVTGSSSTSSTMTTNFPDAIQCALGTDAAQQMFLYSSAITSGNLHYYYYPGSNSIYIVFNNDGTYNTQANLATTGSWPCTTGTTISSLYAAGRAFNFVGGSGVSGTTSSGDRITSGTVSAIANTSGGYISLTTGATTWGYLGSSATFLPTLSGNTVSYTSILGTLSTANQPNITGLGTITNLNATTANIATVVASTVSSSSGLFTNLGATGTSTLGTVTANTISVTTGHFNSISVSNITGGGGNTIVSGTTSVSASNVGSGSIKFATAGTMVMTISGSYVGIGTSTPSRPVHLKDASGSGFQLEMSHSSTSSDRILTVTNASGTVGVWDGAGNLGIGTAAPTEKLELSTGSNIKMGYEVVTNTGSTSFSVGCSSGKQVLGGGCQCTNGGGNYVRASWPNGTTAWSCMCDSGSGNIAYAICANMK